MPHISAKYRTTEEDYAEKQQELERIQPLLKRAEMLKSKLDVAFNQDKENSSKIQTGILRGLADPQQN